MRDEESRRACAKEAPLFAATWEAPASAPEVIQAKRVCRGCALVLGCLRENLEERDGVWGATTGRERASLRRRRRDTVEEHTSQGGERNTA